MTQIHLAKSAGFCFGVSRAVDRVNALLDAGRRVCTLGPIIHNPQVVEKLAARGVLIRNCANYRGLGAGYYRTAVRSGDDTARLFAALDAIRKEGC